MAGSSFKVGGAHPVDRRYALAGPIVTSLPSTGSRDGDTIRYRATAAATTSPFDVIWTLVYDSASGYWFPVGSPPLFKEVDSSGGETTTSTSYVNLATTGPALTLPLAGDYMFAYGCESLTNTNASAALMSPDFGGGATNLDEVAVQGAASTVASQSRNRAKTITAGQTVTLKYAVTGAATATFLFRWLNVQPLRVH